MNSPLWLVLGFVSGFLATEVVRREFFPKKRKPWVTEIRFLEDKLQYMATLNDGRRFVGTWAVWHHYPDGDPANVKLTRILRDAWLDYSPPDG